MTIPTLTNHIETRSSRDCRSRWNSSFSAWLMIRLSIPSSEIFLAGLVMRNSSIPDRNLGAASDRKVTALAY